ncbi:hypothetical protein [Tautonia plasticadhaerens]|uniref:Uncharacterized protein n=1 Tax=Tautonia plasticadhaerens TaxID=2527974 RepID=A0A518H277_9BACT|nr:hypothetical protein [Tautonia plasticadhaerens]QDV34949.1 hypothetical protein ElP_28460 [Tautonia plasticadhaerens]
MTGNGQISELEAAHNAIRDLSERLRLAREGLMLWRHGYPMGEAGRKALDATDLTKPLKEEP